MARKDFEKFLEAGNKKLQVKLKTYCPNYIVKLAETKECSRSERTYYEGGPCIYFIYFDDFFPGSDNLTFIHFQYPFSIRNFKLLLFKVAQMSS